MSKTTLGRVMLVPKGEYNAQTEYERLDVVRYGTASYIALRSVQGVTPADGEDYMLFAQGTPGETGYSPTASVKETDSGAEITITDKSGTTTATVSNGKPGDTPVRGTDYWTEADKVEIVQDTLAALPTWTGGSY